MEAFAAAAADDLTTDPAVDAVNLAAAEPPAALVLLLLKKFLLPPKPLDIRISIMFYRYSHCPCDGALRRETRSSIALIHCVDPQYDRQSGIARRAGLVQTGVVGARGGRDCGRRAKRSDCRSANNTIGVQIGILCWRQRGDLRSTVTEEGIEERTGMPLRFARLDYTRTG